MVETQHFLCLANIFYFTVLLGLWAFGHSFQSSVLTLYSLVAKLLCAPTQGVVKTEWSNLQNISKCP